MSVEEFFGIAVVTIIVVLFIIFWDDEDQGED